MSHHIICYYSSTYEGSEHPYMCDLWASTSTVWRFWTSIHGWPILWAEHPYMYDTMSQYEGSEHPYMCDLWASTRMKVLNIPTCAIYEPCCSMKVLNIPKCMIYEPVWKIWTSLAASRCWTQPDQRSTPQPDSQFSAPRTGQMVIYCLKNNYKNTVKLVKKADVLG